MTQGQVVDNEDHYGLSLDIVNFSESFCNKTYIFLILNYWAHTRFLKFCFHHFFFLCGKVAVFWSKQMYWKVNGEIWACKFIIKIEAQSLLTQVYANLGQYFPKMFRYFCTWSFLFMTILIRFYFLWQDLNVTLLENANLSVFYRNIFSISVKYPI